MVGPSARQAVVGHLVHGGHCSERKACEVLSAPRATHRYQSRNSARDAGLRKRIRVLAHKHRRYGYRRITALLRREGWGVNVKRIHRLWKEMGMGLKRKRPKRRAYGPKGGVVNKASRMNHVWTYDFLEDRTEKGARVKILCVVDEYTRQCLALEAARSINAQGVLHTLEWLFLVHGRPEHIRSDNGSEFIATAVQDWLRSRGANTLYITPGSPWENPYIESFNDKLRGECLNMALFKNLREVQDVLDAFRVEYNELRPHSSLNYQTPAEFATYCCNSGRPTASLRCNSTGAAPQPMAILST